MPHALLSFTNNNLQWINNTSSVENNTCLKLKIIRVDLLLLHYSKESIDKERKSHDKAIKDLQRAQIEWAKKRQEQLDYINNEIMKDPKA